MSNAFESLAGWETTRETLHKYVNIPSVIAQGHLKKDPKWWHISLEVVEDGLVSNPIPTPAGGTIVGKLNFLTHEMQVISNDGQTTSFDLKSGPTSTALGQQMQAAVSGYGLNAAYLSDKYESDDPRSYDVSRVERYFATLKAVDETFKAYKAARNGEMGPIKLWPHHFDLSIEWFGTRKVPHNEKGETSYSLAQINLGFSSGDQGHPEPYFYSTPWPFEKEALLNKPLPHGARWFTEGWEGSILPYAELIGQPDPATHLQEYAEAVYAAAHKSLMA